VGNLCCLLRKESYEDTHDKSDWGLRIKRQPANPDVHGKWLLNRCFVCLIVFVCVIEMKANDSTSETKPDETETAASRDALENTGAPADMSTSPVDVTDLDQPVPPSSPEQDGQKQSLMMIIILTFTFHMPFSILISNQWLLRLVVDVAA